MRETKGTLDALEQIGCAIEQRFNIRIASDGRWFHEGGEIHRVPLALLLASIWGSSGPKQVHLAGLRRGAASAPCSNLWQFWA